MALVPLGFGLLLALTGIVFGIGTLVLPESPPDYSEPGANLNRAAKLVGWLVYVTVGSIIALPGAAWLRILWRTRTNATPSPSVTGASLEKHARRTIVITLACASVLLLLAYVSVV